MAFPVISIFAYRRLPAYDFLAGKNGCYGGSQFSQYRGKIIVEEERNQVAAKRRTNKMEWQIIVALVLAIPIILFPVAFVWYLSSGGIYAAIREARARRAVHEKGKGVATEVKQAIAVDR